MRAKRLAALAAVAVGPLMGVGIAEAAVASERFRAPMDGRQEVPRGDRDGRGTARITTDAGRGRVCYRISLRRVGSVSAGHIHRGERGKAGPVVVELFAKASRQPRGCATGVSKATIRRIERNPDDFYVNVHNKRYPMGAVRGQLPKRSISY